MQFTALEITCESKEEYASLFSNVMQCLLPMPDKILSINCTQVMDGSRNGIF
jgi:hypothetical protein